jgi:hypothetical protein
MLNHNFRIRFIRGMRSNNGVVAGYYRNSRIVDQNVQRASREFVHLFLQLDYRLVLRHIQLKVVNSCLDEVITWFHRQESGYGPYTLAEVLLHQRLPDAPFAAASNGRLEYVNPILTDIVSANLPSDKCEFRVIWHGDTDQLLLVGTSLSTRRHLRSPEDQDE